MKYYHVDVFTNKALSGNGLTVIKDDGTLSSDMMQRIAQEFKQFETIFISSKKEYAARIFTVEEELDFAGHPVLGLGAIIHTEDHKEKEEISCSIKLNKKTVTVHSKKEKDFYKVSMNQGQAEWGQAITKEWKKRYCKALQIEETMLAPSYPMEVVSTGLPYLLIPIQTGLESVRISCLDFEEMLSKNGAKFVYVFDIAKMEGRTWDNLGNVEDVATGSAAGLVGAYLYKHGYCRREKQIILHQGRFVRRPSEIFISMNEKEELIVSGNVKLVAKGEVKL